MCGARLAAPNHDGSAATTPGGTTPAVTIVPETETPNVVYLPQQPGAGEVPANPRAYDYDGVTPPEPPAPAGPTPVDAPPIPLHPSQLTPPTPINPTSSYAEEVAASLSAAGRATGEPEPYDAPRGYDLHPVVDPPEAFGSHGPVPQAHELEPPATVEDNPFGDFFSDGPSAWLEDDPDDADEPSVELTHVRVKGTLLALVAMLSLAGGWAWIIAAMVRGSGGAEAGAFVLVAMLAWIGYLSLPRTDQHAALLRIDRRIATWLDRGVNPLHARTTGTLAMRRERERYRAMRDERTRRIAALGEGAYRTFRRGQLPVELGVHAQRVLAMERQMMLQDHRIHELMRGADAGAGAAAEPPAGGHDPE